MSNTSSARIKADEEELEALKKERAEAEGRVAPTPDEDEAAAVQADPNASEEDKNWAKRYSDTKSAWYKERNDKDAQIKRLQESISASTQAEELPTTVEDLKKWQLEHPQVAGAIKAMATEIAKDMTSGLETQVADLSQKEQQTTQQLTKAKVVKVHPDFDNLNASKKFHEWVKEQDAWVDEAVYKGFNAQNIINAINLYKLENNLLGSKDETPSGNSEGNKAEVDAASLVTKSKATTPPSPTSKYLYESEVIKWTPEEWEKNKPRYDQARRDGTLFLDVTNPKRA
jgi:hypothetical protein